MLFFRGPISSHTNKLLHQCRNAFTRNVKKGVKKTQKHNPPSPKPSKPKHNVPSSQPKYQEVMAQTWVIEPRIPFLQAKLRTPKSPSVILVTIGFALTSIYLTSTAFPDPSAPPPSTSPSTTTPETQDSTITSTVLYPITFIFRPLFVDENVIDDSKNSWRYKLGFAAGIASILLFAVSHLKGPRYVRYLSISPKNVNAGQTAGTGAVTGAGTGSAQPVAGGGGAIMQIYPAFSRHCVTHPVSRTTLVSPLLNEKERVLSTIRIVGAPRSIGSVGWGVDMFKDGALVNGRPMGQEQVVSLMEKIWIAHGGKISVA